MRKLTQMAAIGLIALMPALAFAHNGGEAKGLLKANLKTNTNTKINWNLGRPHSGTVTAVSATGFDIKTEDGATFNVNTSGAIIMKAFGSKIALTDIHVNDEANIRGTTSGAQITAKTVVITPANTHVAKGGGKVTAVNGNSLTVQQNNHGIISSFTVNTNANTTVTGSNHATTTVSAVTVGSKISVKGLWDEILNVLNAIKIRIR